MRTIIYCIYYVGAIVFGLTTTYLDAIPAAITTLMAPILLLQIVEMSGKVKFTQTVQEASTPIQISMEQGLSDEEAINKFGWAMIVEMDQLIEETKTQLETMQKSREEMAAMHKKENK
jgi:hypothetical protein